MIAPTRKHIVRGVQRSSTATVAAPVGGWNARDALAAMHKHDAVVLQNFWPGTSSVKLRKGYTEHATGLPDAVETLMVYNGGGTSTMYAASGTAIYNVTSPGAVGAAVKSSLTNARFQYVNFTTAGGAIYLLAVNGADKLISWNGSAWHDDGDGTHDITGFDTVNATNITVFKNRVWLIGTNSLKAWYLQINAVAGAATALDMSSLCAKGGYLVAAMTWTLDGGNGMDDHLAFITSEGEVLVWQLTDPTAPSGIRLVGVWQIGAPVGRRCYLKYGGDLLLITNEGVVALAKRLPAVGGNPSASITDKIQIAMADAVTQYGANFGWQLLNYPNANQLYLNVPVGEGDQQQFVQNNITRAWCNFTNWDANCWELFNDEPYFGGDGVVNQAWSGTTDNGANIDGLALQSFQAYGGARQKQCKMLRYHLRSDGAPRIFGDVNVDFDLSDRSAELTTSAPDVGLWDIGEWDIAVWGSDLVASADWQGATGIGYTFAPLLKTATNGIQLEWSATDMVFEVGGTI